MVVLLGIAFLAGVITAISPCVLPVLPIVLAGGASGGRRRPYAIIAGLVGSFFASVLFVAWLLQKLGLPQDLLRNVAIALLFVVAATLVVPELGVLVERPLARLARRPSGDLGGGLLLGASLGLVFVPCGGPVLAYVSAQAASVDFGARTIGLALAYAIGAGVPLLLIALGGRHAAERTRALRANARAVRAALGVVVAGAALAIVFNVDRTLQTRLGDYTDLLQRHTEKTAYARRKLGLSGHESRRLEDFGAAPDFRGIADWLNTPGGRPLSTAALRGKVVLVDFWTYSCINCLRTLPHLKAWYATYRPKGLVVVGVHTPEFSFEHVPANVRQAVRELGVRYPVALDNRYATWNAYANQYWPAEYLLDRRGHVRHVHFGEGQYDETERLIRTLLAEPTTSLPVASRLADPTPHDLTTPETYVGYRRLDRYAGESIAPDRLRRYRFPPRVEQNELAYGGGWRVEAERIISRQDARLRLHFHARDVFLVAGGRGRIDVLVGGKRVRRLRVAGISRLYTLVRSGRVEDALLELRFTPGLAAYSFTFG